MIPAGYVDSIFGWARSPELTDDERTARGLQLLALRDALVGGQLTAGSVSTMTTAGVNGKSFAFLPQITAAEKLPLITNVLGRLGLLDEHCQRGTLTFGQFTGIVR